MYDIVIIGGGPAGLTAAVYALRSGKSVMILEKGAFGGQITYSPKVENVPGFLSVSGNEIADKMVEQALSQGAEVGLETVTGIRDNGDTKTVVTDEGEYTCKAVVIAVGVKHRMTGVGRENDFVGNGISFCAVCDGAFYRGEDVAVIGGGNSALQEAILLSEGCKSVTVVQNLAFLTGEKKLADALKEKENVKIIYSSVVKELSGEDSLTGITVENEAGEQTKLNVTGMFVAIGLVPENDVFAAFAELNDYGYFDSGENCTTKTPGIFVAGDCRSKEVRQVTTAAADGAVAALAACKYIDNIK